MKDPISKRPQFVIAYRVEASDMFRFVMCDGETDLIIQFNQLYGRQDVMCLRTFSMTESHRREVIYAWTQEHE